jgi:ribonucleoside-diphosphate reductase alpha chain
MISSVFRRGGEVAFAAEELKQVFDPAGRSVEPWLVRWFVVAAIGDIIERHLVETGFLVPAEALVAKVGQVSAGATATRLGLLCPKCSQPGLVKPGA